MSREALGIWRGSYEASVTGGRENRRAMLMVTREYSGLRQLSEMDDGADAAELARSRPRMWLAAYHPKKEHGLESSRAPSFGVLLAEYQDVLPS